MRKGLIEFLRVQNNCNTAAKGFLLFTLQQRELP